MSLVITRSIDEIVAIGPPEKPLGFVTVGAIKGDRVRLVFDFPESVPIHREGIRYRILRQLGLIDKPDTTPIRGE